MTCLFISVICVLTITLNLESIPLLVPQLNVESDLLSVGSNQVLILLWFDIDGVV